VGDIRGVFRDFSKLRQVYSPLQLLFGAALLFAGLSLTVVTVVGNEGNQLDWFIQIAATFVGALLAFAGGIWLYRLQEQDREEKLEKRLGTRVAVEAKMNLWLLESGPSSLIDESTGPVEEKVVLVMLSREALTDLIRNDVTEPDDAMRAMNYEGSINVHNMQIQALLNARSSPLPSHTFQTISKDIARRQENLRVDFRALVQSLREQGLEVPDFGEAIGVPHIREEDEKNTP
jgi:hypothetical protein